MVRVALGLGSNLGDRKKNLLEAIGKFSFFKDIKLSSFYETKALLPKDAPKSWNIDYINMAVSGYTELTPLKLLKNIKDIEKQLGRPLYYDKWSPRIIDIDILLYGARQVKLPQLIIPHRELFIRDFALVPLKEIELELYELNLKRP